MRTNHETPASTCGLLLLLVAGVLAGCDGCVAGTALQEARPSLVVSPEQLVFGATWLGQAVRLEVTLSNTGSAPAQLAGVAVEGEGPFFPERAPAAVEAGETQQLAVFFRPETGGTFLARLVLEDQEGNRSTVVLIGEGKPIPRCDDGNACTLDRFDVVTSACVTENREGACDDGSACTTDDRCAEGGCVGVAVVCAEHGRCTRPVCQPALGCTTLPDPTVCNDDDPCTVDRCDALDGCSHAPALDGTACGAVDGCNTLSMCAAGRCQTFPVPDGYPCNDQDFCSVGDHCEAHACVGTREQRPQAVTGRALTFGGRLVEATALLSRNRVLFVDHPQLPGSDVVVGREAALTVVRATREGLERLTVTPIPVPLEDETVTRVFGELMVRTASGPLPPVSELWNVAQDTPVLLSTVDHEDVFPVDMVVSGSTLHVCGYGARYGTYGGYVFTSVDLTNPAAPFTTSGPLILPGSCSGLEVLSDTQVLVWLADGSGQESTAVVDTSSGVPVLIQPGPALERRSWVRGAISFGLILQTGSVDGRTHISAIEVVERTTLQHLGTLSFPEDGPRHVAVAAHGEHVFTVAHTGNAPNGVPIDFWLFHHSLADPSAPVLVASIPLSPWEIGQPATNGSTVLVQSAWGPPLVVHVAPDGSMSKATSPYHGPLRRVVTVGDGLYGVSAWAVHGLTLDVQGNPTMPHGGTFSEWAAAVRVGAAGAGVDVPVWPEPHRDEGTWVDGRAVTVSWTSGLLGLVDARDTQQPRQVMVRVPHPETSFLFAGRGNTLASLTVPGLVLDVYVGGAPFIGSEPALVPFASGLVNPLEPVEDGTWTVAVSMALSRDRDQVALVLNSTTFVIPDPDPRPPELHVFRVIGGTVEPAAAARTSAAREVRSVDIEGPTVLVLESPIPDLYNGGPYGPVARPAWLAVFDLDEATHTLTQRGDLPLPLSTHLLMFDGRTALVATLTGVMFVDVTETPPRVLGELATPQQALDATVYHDRLVVAGPSGVMVVSPPCPPL